MSSSRCEGSVLRISNWTMIWLEQYKWGDRPGDEDIFETLRLCLDWWVVVEWNGMWCHFIKFHCLDWWDVNGMEWNTMESIPFYTTHSFNSSFPPIWGYPMEWNLCLEILLFYPHFICLFLYSNIISHTSFSPLLPTDCSSHFFLLVSSFLYFSDLQWTHVWLLLLRANVSWTETLLLVLAFLRVFKNHFCTPKKSLFWWKKKVDNHCYFMSGF